MKIRYLTLLTPLMAAIILASCGSSGDSSAWDEAKTENTIESYRKYISENPEGKYIADAQGHIGELLLEETLIHPERLLQIFDDYSAEFPEGEHQEEFETMIYNRAVENSSIQAFEEYAVRFPRGRYLQEFETALFNSIVEGGSAMSFETYLERFPAGKHRDEIDDIFFDSLMLVRSIPQVERYLTSFPEGRHAEEVQKLAEEVYHENAVESNLVADLNVFLEKFPESPYVKRIILESDPEGANLIVSDQRKRRIAALKTPAEMRAPEGFTIHLKYMMTNYRSDSAEYTIGSDSIQTVSLTLRSSARYLSFDEFNGKSAWEGTGSGYNFSVTDDQMLRCESSERQFQKTRTFDIDFSKDFFLEMRLRFTGEGNSNKSYCGFIWGDNNGSRYFFLTREGKYSFGQQEDRLRSPDNPNGYSQWNPNSGASDTWIMAGNFRKNDFNAIALQKKGNVLVYSLNGQSLYQENIFRNISGKMVGVGTGNAQVLLDYIKIAQ